CRRKNRINKKVQKSIFIKRTSYIKQKIMLWNNGGQLYCKNLIVYWSLTQGLHQQKLAFLIMKIVYLKKQFVIKWKTSNNLSMLLINIISVNKSYSTNWIMKGLI